MTETIVHGTAQARFEPVRGLMAASFASGADVGASFAATIDGETVVDLWGGWADEAKTRPWEADTIVNVYSTTKTMTALTALLIADRGDLDFAAPVARYWPEFAQAGKQGVTVGHLMSHASGLSGWEEVLEPEDLYDWEKVTSLLAAQAPWWEPGTQPGYHAITQGYLVGEVVRRITGKSLGTVFREEIAEPLGADFHIGFSDEHDSRVADLIPPPAALGDWISDIQRKSLGNPPSTR
jgi:CubicO group peptidase (beta-lactamase class C family)